MLKGMILQEALKVDSDSLYGWQSLPAKNRVEVITLVTDVIEDGIHLDDEQYESLNQLICDYDYWRTVEREFNVAYHHAVTRLQEVSDRQSL